MKPPIIKTLETLELIHQALDSDDEEQRACARSAFSALMPYVRQPKAPVQRKHYDAIMALYEVMKR